MLSQEGEPKGFLRYNPAWKQQSYFCGRVIAKSVKEMHENPDENYEQSPWESF